MTLDDSQPAPHEQVPELTPDIRAAEYVLGTLDAAEREEAQALIASDPVFAALVRDWEGRLGELHALADHVDPPAAVWDAIKAKLPETAQTAPIRSRPT
jgi:anti-sigma-K factor RskA